MSSYIRPSTFHSLDSDYSLQWDDAPSQRDPVFANSYNTSENQPLFSNQSSLFYSPSPNTHPMIQIQLQAQEIQMLKNENKFLKMQNENLMQMMSNLSQRPAFSPRNSLPDDPLRPLVHTQHPSVKFWQRGPWNNVLKPNGITGSPNTAPDGRIYTPTSFLFAEDATGLPPTEDTVAGMKTAAPDIFTDLARQGLLPAASLGWSQAGYKAKSLFYASIEKRFPDLRLCSNNWKADWIATHMYSNWKAAHGAKYLQQSIKSEEDTPDISSPSPLKSPRKQSSKRPRANAENSIPEATTSKRNKTANAESSEHKSRSKTVTLSNPLRRTSTAQSKMVSAPPKIHASSASSALATPASTSTSASSLAAATASHATSTSIPSSTLPPVPPPSMAPTSTPTLPSTSTVVSTPTFQLVPPTESPAAPPPAADISPPAAVVSPSPVLTSPTKIIVKVPALSIASAPPSLNAVISTPNPLNALALAAANASTAPQVPITALSSAAPNAASGPSTSSSAPSAKNKKSSNGPTARALCQKEWLAANPGQDKTSFRDYWNSLGKEEKEKWKIRETRARQAYAQALGPSSSTA
ncbi:hypothetical protein R3P38DRAFT_3223708 [Favolaschia claudopus]|uniref:Uncharacterized protein n=1 Tax=Favolaschia claudopus TaxID=2862362 RepID=A0AAV9ZW35_9AGAR